MRTLLVLAAVAALAFASNSLAYKKKSNLTDAKDDFPYRNTEIQVLTELTHSSLLWTSKTADAADPNPTSSYFVGLLPNNVLPPVGFLYHGKSGENQFFDITRTAEYIFARESPYPKFNGTAVAMIAIGMRECDPNNKPVNNYVFLNAPGTSSPKVNQNYGDGTNLFAYSKKYSPSGNTAEVNISYVTSRYAGVIEYGNAPVSPRSVEMIIEVNNFHLNHDKDHICMDIGLITPSGAGRREGNSTVVRKDGMDDVYAAVSEFAIVGDKRENVKVVIDANSSLIEIAIKDYLNAALNSTIGIDVARVHFPAGVKSFIYDPALGSGKNIYPAGASTTALSLLLALISVLAYLL